MCVSTLFVKGIGSARSGAKETNALHGGGKRLAVRAVKDAGVWRSLERSEDP